MADVNKKKTVNEILLERFLKEVDETEQMPWQQPYKLYNSFNYFTKRVYSGINRFLLPFGEYLTANQINEYNKKTGEDYKFQKGIKWHMVFFVNHREKDCTPEEVANIKANNLKYINGWYVKETEEGYKKYKSSGGYYNVADRQWFRNSKGDVLPSRIETGEVLIEYSDAEDVINSYVSREGIRVQKDYAGVPCYVPSLDLVQLNPHTNSSESWYSTAFHELAHSTGASNRLNRVGITNVERGSENYAREECIAELCAYLLCCECNIGDFKTSSMLGEYKNNLAYVQGWKKRIKDFGSEFVYVCSEVDKAFNYIMGVTPE